MTHSSLTRTIALAATALLTACGSGGDAPAPTASEATSVAGQPEVSPAPAGTAASPAAPTPSASATPTTAATPTQAAASPCLTQDGSRLAVAPLRAVGTEPFWGARIEGRCVTYSHPDDQQGTRVWTRYAAAAGGGGTWTGNLDGRPFVLTVRREAGCSDGMSDERYPFAVALTVAGEQRQGCAKPV